MDESTSNLDFATENIIFDMIYKIVMDKGKIIEQGTHKELLEKKGQYYRLWEMQQGNFVIRQDESVDKQNETELDDGEVMSYT